MEQLLLEHKQLTNDVSAVGCQLQDLESKQQQQRFIKVQAESDLKVPNKVSQC